MTSEYERDIEKRVGLSIEQIRSMSVSERAEYIANTSRKPVIITSGHPYYYQAIVAKPAGIITGLVGVIKSFFEN